MLALMKCVNDAINKHNCITLSEHSIYTFIGYKYPFTIKNK